MAEFSNISGEFNIIEFAKNVMTEIERVRSLQLTGDGGVSVPKESRLNSFFRLIGLPMIVTTKKNSKKTSGDLDTNLVLTPGYSVSFSKKLFDYNIENSKDIASEFGSLKDREAELLKIESSIGNEDINNNMLMALKFPLPLKADFSDSNLYKLIFAFIGRSVFKKLNPLVTCYVKGGVLPLSREIARPFLTSPQEQCPDNETILPKPFIETVIRIRLTSTGGGQNQDEFISGIKKIVGEDNFNEIFSQQMNVFSQNNLLEQYIVDQLFRSFKKLAEEWTKLENTRQEILNEIGSGVVIKTNTDSSKQNYFNKRIAIDTNALLADQTNSDKNESSFGKKMKNLKTEQIKWQALLSLLPIDGNTTVNKSDYTSTKNVVTLALVSSFMKLIQCKLSKIDNDIKKINDDIEKKSTELDNLRVKMEMMTGEFTGVSIPDIVVVITALFLIEKEDLIFLVDKYVREDMKNDPDPSIKEFLKSIPDISSVEDTIVAVRNLKTTTEGLYQLLNIMIDQSKNKEKRNKNINEI